jgi:hypothetical protein
MRTPLTYGVLTYVEELRCRRRHELLLHSQGGANSNACSACSAALLQQQLTYVEELRCRRRHELLLHSRRRELKRPLCSHLLPPPLAPQACIRQHTSAYVTYACRMLTYAAVCMPAEAGRATAGAQEEAAGGGSRAAVCVCVAYA